MIAVDTNILIHAHRRDLPSHRRAVTSIRRLAEGDRLWAIPWPCIHEFLAVVTRPALWRDPTPLARALEQVDEWAGSPTVRLLAESAQHRAILADLLDAGPVVGAKVHDARIAAICLGHGVKELWTADRDFSRFPRLVTRNPLVV